MGTSSLETEYLSIIKDHPHAYGDKVVKETILKCLMGSSPRVWGQAFIRHRLKLMKRIIPTRVGTSDTIDDYAAHGEDHPHACGDKTLGRANDNYQKGSSPRVWGQVFVSVPSVKQPRIIPTRVGTSGRGFGGLALAGDHPHACGDKRNFYDFNALGIGSSPRVWGQDVLGFLCLPVTRIIPTRVGTRTPTLSTSEFSEDHPHACGDKLC